ncbi:Inner membrane protein YrbG, predicted calcium/sodium:proton antiporter [hydrothermal vent metagenome]|uniref:Inner membrane protein YrbG, predicted calcium/sodium:proton antiporter n=1 Tax=hydrothermal vent metagenome TaxID=652676 RepID=A0A3B0TAW6_9ZZZZ
MAPTLFFITGLVLLVLSGDFLVRGAVAIAQRLHVPSIIVGLTIISMGTSAPELFVSLQAALNGAPDLAIGNAVGSNIANSLLVLGLPALLAPIYFIEPGARRSVVFMMFITITLLILALDGAISGFDGWILLSLFALYLAYSFAITKSAINAGKLAALVDIENKTDQGAANLLSVPLSLGYLLFGIIGLGIGAKLTVDGALGIATTLGIGQTVVGTTIVALGTTLPEIAATMAAAMRRHSGVAIGNVIGSNIFNILAILGLTSTIVPLPVASRIMGFDLWVMLVTSALLVPMAFIRRPFKRKIGAALTLTYLAYLYVSFTGLMVG